jgi:ATP-dependent Lon protease
MTVLLPGDLRDALRELPLFPLQQAVLFPGTLLPLHVFEARYRAMVKDALGRHRALSVVYVPDAKADMGGNPAIADIAGVGTIVEHQELAGGRYNIVLLGRARVRLQELHFKAPYRRALASLLESPGIAVPDIEVAALHTAISSFSAVVRRREPSFRVRLPKNAAPGAVADACANHLVLDARERQQLLETLDERQRVRQLTAILTMQATTLAPRCGPTN